MRHYLLVYERARRELVAEHEFDNSAEALRARFRVEREGMWEGRPLSDDVEVVVLRAESAQTLRRTHARYFMTAREIARTVQLP
jgi:hypothetical protein